MSNPVERVFDATAAEKIAHAALYRQAQEAEQAWTRIAADALKRAGVDGDYTVEFDAKAGKFTAKPKPVEACPIGA